jgi:nucleoside-diphosphate-sugar epimerase
LQFKKFHLTLKREIGSVSDCLKVSNPQEYYEAYYELTNQLFNVFLNSEVKVFVFMSTVKSVADEKEEVLTEDAVPNFCVLQSVMFCFFMYFNRFNPGYIK